MQKAIEKTKQQQEKLTNIPAALSYAAPPPKIETQPIPATAPKPKPAEPKPEQKPIPKETQILLHGLTEIEDILYAMRLQIGQLYGVADKNNTEDIAKCFPPELADKLSFERILYTEDYIIRLKGYLGPEFNKIRDIITDMGGSYDRTNRYFIVKRS